MNEDDHSWREIDLGGGATLTVSLSGNLLLADSSARAWLLRLCTVDEFPSSPEPVS